MVKKIIQDVVPGKRKKLETNIHINIKKEEAPDVVRDEDSKDEPSVHRKNYLSSKLFSENKKYTTPFPKLPKRKGERFWEKQQFWWSFFVVLVVGSALTFFSFFYLRASVEIKPSRDFIKTEIGLNAKKGATSGIPFEIMVTKGTEAKQVNATGTQKISTKASGRIVVYNNYSSSAQMLVKGTRFVSSSGKTFRIQNEIVVPGKKGDTPGSIEVTVYGDQAGEEYNVGLTDFTIPGFKGDPRYDKFYARSKTEIKGGFSGVAPVASEEDISIAKLSIEKSLKEDLLRDAISQVPDGYILYKDAIQVDFETAKDFSNDSKNISVTENGTLVGVILKKDLISNEVFKKISKESVDKRPFSVDSIDDLVFAFGKDTALNENTKEISFSLTGNTSIVYDVNVDSLKEALSGKSLSDFSKILSRYPSIKEGRVTRIQPFWARSFPSKTDKISITIVK